MGIHFRKYGKVIEITEIEHEPSKVRVYAPRIRPDVHGSRRSDSIRRTRTICLWRVFAGVEEFGSPLLVTLTFDGDASDASYANDTLRRFQVRLRDQYPEAQSLFVPELSPRGRIHFHGLLFNLPMHLGDTRQGRRIVEHGTERKDRIIAQLWGEGFVDVRKTDGSPRLGYYIAKYITKGSEQTLFNAMRILRISRGFPRQIEISGPMAEELKRRYDPKTPIKEWEGNNIFLGKIKRKTYIQDT